MNVALYLRMSTDKQDTSIPQQRAALEQYAKRNGHKIVREYRDEGISGDATHKRKAFQQMIADAPGGNFDRILCWDQDRFGRFDMIEAGRWISPLRDAGVDLETVAQGVIDWNDFAGRLTYAVAQEGKHQFLRDLSRNCLRSHVDLAKSGASMYGAPTTYGYRRESHEDLIHGRRRRISKLVPHPLHAEVVRRIFATYTRAGGSLLAVGEMLNGEGIASPSGRGPWHRNAVRRVLRNRLYIGDYVWGKTSSGKYFTRAGDEIVRSRLGGRSAIRNDPIVHEGILPALVPREQFDKAQELLDCRRKATRRPGTVRPLSGLITCAKCGSPMHVNFGDYRCSRGVRFGDGTQCTTPIARGEHLLRQIAEQLQKHLLAPQKLAAVKARLHRMVAAEYSSRGTQSTAGLDREIAEIERQIAEGIARIPLVPKTLVPEMAKGLDSMREQRDALKRQRDAGTAKQRGRRPPMQKRIDEAIAAAYALPKAFAAGDAAALNEGLRNLGLQVLFDDRRARVIVDPMNPKGPAKIGRKPLETRNGRPGGASTGTRAVGRPGSRRGRD